MTHRQDTRQQGMHNVSGRDKRARCLHKLCLCAIGICSACATRSLLAKADRPGTFARFSATAIQYPQPSRGFQDAGAPLPYQASSGQANPFRDPQVYHSTDAFQQDSNWAENGQQPVRRSSGRWKKWTVAVIILLVLAGIGGGIAAWKYDEHKKETEREGRSD